MAPDDAEVEGAMGVYLRAALPRLRGLERSPLNRAAAWLQARPDSAVLPPLPIEQQPFSC